MKSVSKILVVIAAVVIFNCSSDEECNTTASTTELKSNKVTNAPTIDGVSTDDAWVSNCLASLNVDVSANTVYTPSGSATSPSYPGLTNTQVTLKSVYTTTDVYFLATWSDPTKSLARYPWEKQADGSWKQLKNKDSSGHENTYYEDKFGMQWDINTTDFKTQGCYAGCHTISDTNDANYPGKKYNNKSGEVTDIWHWKAVRTNANTQLDDKYVKYQASTANGRSGDTKTSGGYKDNTFAKYNAGGGECGGKTTDPAAPCFMGASGVEKITSTNPLYWLTVASGNIGTPTADTGVQNFVDNFSTGDQIAGMMTSPFVGSRGDVTAKATYSSGKWTLEIKRSLTTTTGASEDVQFNDLTSTYNFGVAVFDNTQINHAVHAGVLKLTFEQ